MTQLALIVGVILFVSSEARLSTVPMNDVSLTVSGKCCQPWNTLANTALYHKSNYFNYNRLHANNHIHKNYCRTTEGTPRHWCYTMDKNTRWEYCMTPPQYVTATNYNDHKCVEYEGTLSTTVSGHTCQKWNAQHPHTHDRTPSSTWDSYGFADRRLGNHNYCRNPERDGGGRKIWCYTTNPAVRWDVCEYSVLDVSWGY